jgi:hypothetical protein
MTRIRTPTDRRPGSLNSAPPFDVRGNNWSQLNFNKVLVNDLIAEVDFRARARAAASFSQVSTNMDDFPTLQEFDTATPDI